MDIKILQKSPITDALYIECPTCKGKTTDDDLTICSTKDCESIICSNCSSTGIDGKILCEKCWGEE